MWNYILLLLAVFSGCVQHKTYLEWCSQYFHILYMHSAVSPLLYILESYTVQFTGQYIGCYKDKSLPRAFSGAQINFHDSNSIETCVNYCGNKGRLCSFIKCKTYSWEVKGLKETIA